MTKKREFFISFGVDADLEVEENKSGSAVGIDRGAKWYLALRNGDFLGLPTQKLNC